MGVGRSYVALPGDCDLIERARTDPEFGDVLGLAAIYVRRGPTLGAGPSSPETRELRRRLAEVVAADRAGVSRVFDVDKRWDQLHFLLAERRRGGAEDVGQSALGVAVEGEAVIADHVRGTQGWLVRYTSARAVGRVAEELMRVDADGLRRHYDLGAMEEHGVYKAFAGRESEGDWAYLRELVEGLAEFYRSAAGRGDLVLVVTD